MIALKHSLRTLKQDTASDKNDLDYMKTMYTKWIQSTYTKYKIDKAKIMKFTTFLKDFLKKVCD